MGHSVQNDIHDILAVEEDLELAARDGERHAVPLVVGQPHRNGFHSHEEGGGRSLLQEGIIDLALEASFPPHFPVAVAEPEDVLPPGGLQLQDDGVVAVTVDSGYIPALGFSFCLGHTISKIEYEIKKKFRLNLKKFRLNLKKISSYKIASQSSENEYFLSSFL